MLGLSVQPHSQGTQLDRTCWQSPGLWETAVVVVGRHHFSSCPLHRETCNGSARRGQNSSSCWKLQGFGLKPPHSKTMRPALKLAAAQWEQPSCAAEL